MHNITTCILYVRSIRDTVCEKLKSKKTSGVISSMKFPDPNRIFSLSSEAAFFLNHVRLEFLLEF